MRWDRRPSTSPTSGTTTRRCEPSVTVHQTIPVERLNGRLGSEPGGSPKVQLSWRRLGNKPWEGFCTEVRTSQPTSQPRWPPHGGTGGQSFQVSVFHLGSGMRQSGGKANKANTPKSPRSGGGDTQPPGLVTLSQMHPDVRPDHPLYFSRGCFFKTGSLPIPISCILVFPLRNCIFYFFQ